MCGIFGLVGDQHDQSIDKSVAAIKHRGPDDSGIYADDWIKLGFRRLSIIDLSAKGHQPMTNEDGNIWCIFNGEIYNYQDNRKILIDDHHFRSNSDTEILIHGYEQWGIDGLLNKINGMFAFCLYDKRKREVYLARDRIGKKPLYYYKNNDFFAFASEAKAFFPLTGFDFHLDEEMLDLWFGFPYLPVNDRTIIKNILKLPPATYLKINAEKKLTFKKYWSLPTRSSRLSFEESQFKLETLLVDSVKRRLMADVPLGILLSGGIDSSLITAIAGQNSQKKLKTITISFKNTVIDDDKAANCVAKHCQTDHTNVFPDIKNIYRQFKDHIDIYDDLSTTDSGLFSEYLLAQEIRKLGIVVALVGEGADEIFGGYSWFQLSQFPFSFLPQRVNASLYYYALMRVLPNKKYLRYYDYLYRQLNEDKGSIFKKIQRFEILHSLPNHYCMKVDKGTMASAIEARAPYMDYRLVELAAKLPDRYLLNSGFYRPDRINEKYILRKIAEKYLPGEIAYKKKKGGMMPVYDVLNQGLRRDKRLIIDNPYLTEFFGRDFLIDLINSAPNLSVFKWQREWLLWKCLVFALWHNHYSGNSL